eukprot:snap_masked-scaffold_8-processed-gene-6.47-mRNA-1 protein AED:1.00 eAED:1.00 QI:0/-1/0/0/-1/1/1/0/513
MPKGSNNRLGKLSATEKREFFWKSLVSQKKRDIIDILTLTGFEAQTRNAANQTCFMYCVDKNKPESLEVLLDFYERRRILRPRGWINLRDSSGKTALMQACERGLKNCIEVLVLCEKVDLDLKDFNGQTARDFCLHFDAKFADTKKNRNKEKMIQFFDNLVNPPESESEDDGELEGENIEGLTSTQKSKLKKKKLKVLERNFGEKEVSLKKKEKETVDVEEIPEPEMDEVKKVIESIKNLRELKELSIFRDEEIKLLDPALFYLTGINRLEIKILNLDNLLLTKDLQRLKNLQTLILSGNRLTYAPKEVGVLKNLKSLDLSNNLITKLEKSLNFEDLEALENLKLENNQIEKMETRLPGSLMSFNISGNKLKSLDFVFGSDVFLLKNLYAKGNEIEKISDQVAFLVQLQEVNLEDNSVTELPSVICQLKKVKVLNLALGNKIKDQKVVKMLKNKGKLKDLWKYLKKNGGDKSVQRVVYQVKKEEETVEPSQNLLEDLSDLGSDCSFDITFEEL